MSRLLGILVVAWVTIGFGRVDLGAVVVNPNANSNTNKDQEPKQLKQTEQQSVVVFDNTASTIALIPYHGTEMGSKVTLATSLTNRSFLRFKFQYYLGANATGNETAQLRFYYADGPNGAPSEMPFFAPAPIPLLKGTNTYVLEAVPFVIPDAFVWTIQFLNASGVDSGVLFNGPPTVGFGTDSVWERIGGKWASVSAPQSQSGFAAQVIASFYDEPAGAPTTPLPGTPATPAGGTVVGPQPVVYQQP